MALTQPLFQQNDTSDQHAHDMRRILDTLFRRTGGVVGTTDFQVVQRLSGTNNSVDIRSGTILIPGTNLGGMTQGLYHLVNDNLVNMPIVPAHSTLARRDLLIVKVRDSFYSGGDDDAVFEWVEGTPGSGSDPDPYALGHRNYWVLARLRLGSGVANVSNNIIDDLRTGYAGQVSKALLMDNEPPGVIKQYAGNVAPAGYLLCEGQQEDRKLYADLFSVIGTRFGVGNGSTTFNMPNFKGRSPIGLDAAQEEFNSLGKLYGSKTHTLSVGEMPAHVHAAPGNLQFAVGSPPTSTMWLNAGVEADHADTDMTFSLNTESTGFGNPHNNVHPVLAIKFIIKY